ncbi:hypothetical protein N7517_010354 [Penicillium concentricum]|uniref:Uncharacterized protein n=1 Tax=Penicillium concentricum TaxID=293559 RepID=A0A9W9R8N9_9EURO|nr:uncharacterized protein N7517_010354 [Penicillium concentricum]KAJ5355745.1 hypothetical protein N7517_010354 [Penicillium concentricum]
MYCKVNLQFGQVYIVPGHTVNSGQRNIRVNVFVKYCMSQTQNHTRSVPLSPAPQLFTDRISLLSIFFSQPQPKQNFSTLILLAICSILLDRFIFDRKFNGYQIGAFPEIRLTAPSPAPTSDQVDPLRTSDSPAERSACRCTSPPALSH